MSELTPPRGAPPPVGGAPPADGATPAETDQLPAYVDAFYDPSAPIPGLLQRCQLMVGYGLGRTASLQALLDTFLNGPCGGAFRFSVAGIPLVGKAVVPIVVDRCFLTAGGMSTTQDPSNPAPVDLGWARYSEATFVIPVWITDGTRKLPAGMSRLQFFMPYIWVSAAPGMASGRESWGYRKTLADIVFPQPASSGVMNFEVRTLFQLQHNLQTQANAALVWGHFPDPKLLYDADNLLEELAGDLLHDLAVKLLGPDVGQASGEIEVDGQRRTVDLAHELGVTSKQLQVSVLNLKQFRDTADTTRACYQAIVSSPISVQDVQALGVVEASEIDLWVSQRSRSYDIIGDLGLDPSGSFPCWAAAYAQLDMSADPGTVLWQAGQGGGG